MGRLGREWHGKEDERENDMDQRTNGGEEETRFS